MIVKPSALLLSVVLYVATTVLGATNDDPGFKTAYGEGKLFRSFCVRGGCQRECIKNTKDWCWVAGGGPTGPGKRGWIFKKCKTDEDCVKLSTTLTGEQCKHKLGKPYELGCEKRCMPKLEDGF